MAGNEGVERLKLLGRRIAVFGGFAGLLLWCAFLLVMHRAGLVELLVLMAAPVLFGGFLQTVAWLIEGLLQRGKS